jgi:type IV secretory pathway TrbD component
MDQTKKNFLAYVGTGCGIIVFILSIVLGDWIYAGVGLLIAWFNYKHI